MNTCRVVATRSIASFTRHLYLFLKLSRTIMNDKRIRSHGPTRPNEPVMATLDTIHINKRRENIFLLQYLSSMNYITLGVYIAVMYIYILIQVNSHK